MYGSEIVIKWSRYQTSPVIADSCEAKVKSWFHRVTYQYWLSQIREFKHIQCTALLHESARSPHYGRGKNNDLVYLECVYFYIIGSFILMTSLLSTRRLQAREFRVAKTKRILNAPEYWEVVLINNSGAPNRRVVSIHTLHGTWIFPLV